MPPEVPLDPDTFRRAMGRFATGVTVVTTVSEGIDHAMTANTFTSVSLEPILVLVCVEREARFHDAVIDSGFWAVSVLRTEGRAAASWFATRGRPLHGQLERVAFVRGPRTGAALLADSLAALEVRTVEVYPGGDHSIVVGEVVGLSLPADGDALLYFRSRYVPLPSSAAARAPVRTAGTRNERHVR